jgi:hypothetical protein
MIRLLNNKTVKTACVTQAVFLRFPAYSAEVTHLMKNWMR